MFRVLLALGLLGACATLDPFNDVAQAQQRLDSRGIGFGVTRVPGSDAFLLQIRFSGADAGAPLDTDPMRAALAAAPLGCSVETITPQGEDGFRVDYDCG